MNESKDSDEVNITQQVVQTIIEADWDTKDETDKVDVSIKNDCYKKHTNNINKMVVQLKLGGAQAYGKDMQHKDWERRSQYVDL